MKWLDRGLIITLICVIASCLFWPFHEIVLTIPEKTIQIADSINQVAQDKIDSMANYVAKVQYYDSVKYAELESKKSKIKIINNKMTNINAQIADSALHRCEILEQKSKLCDEYTILSDSVITGQDSLIKSKNTTISIMVDTMRSVQNNLRAERMFNQMAITEIKVLKKENKKGIKRGILGGLIVGTIVGIIISK